MPKNSNRQQGDRPKVQKTYRLNPDYIQAMEKAATAEGVTVTGWLEGAIALKLWKTQKQSEE